MLLVFLLGFSLVACEDGDAQTTQEGFFGDWYNTAGRKLEIKEDGTYVLADEKDGGTWEKKDGTLLECTDCYGSFSATRAEKNGVETITFGPYGDFHRATEEELARFAQALVLPFRSIHSFENGIAVINEGKEFDTQKSVVINRDGLALSVLEGDAVTNREFWGELVIGEDCIMDQTTGKLIASGRIIGKTINTLRSSEAIPYSPGCPMRFLTPRATRRSTGL